LSDYGMFPLCCPLANTNKKSTNATQVSNTGAKRVLPWWATPTLEINHRRLLHSVLWTFWNYYWSVLLL